MRPRAVAVLALGLALAVSACSSTSATAPTSSSTTTRAMTARTISGTLPDGANYKIDVPNHWNGTLVLYSHGYTPPGSPNPATDVGDPATGVWLTSHGYAMAGSSYATTGWAIEQAFSDQMATLEEFSSTVGKPTRTIAWGHSLGGIITAGLVQLHPETFTAALPMCGVLGGAVSTWNSALDAAFAFKTLLAQGSSLQLVNIDNPVANLGTAQSILSAAMATPQGRARLTLVGALADTPGWFTPGSPEPAPSDYASQQANQLQWAKAIDFPFVFALRAELEHRAGGNFSWNTGVDYRTLITRSADYGELKAVYQQAGLNLDSDLSTLQQAPRISADPSAVSYLERYIVFNGKLPIPMLTMHTTGDGLVVPENEAAYRDTVTSRGDQANLRQVFVHRAGHCAFTPAETVAAFQALVQRINSGQWPSLSPQAMNQQAQGLGPTYNRREGATTPAFISYQPLQPLRPFDYRSDYPGASPG